nr:CapA family protein [Microcoleus sp. FACHB-68]
METLAKQGDPDILAFLINQALRNQGIQATVTRKHHCLHILLEADRVPAQQTCVQFLHNGLNHLNIKSITTVQVYGRQIGGQPVWTQTIDFRQFPLTKLLPSSEINKKNPKKKLKTQPATAKEAQVITKAGTENPSPQPLKLSNNKIKALVFGVSSLSFCLGTGWGFITQSEGYNLSAFLAPVASFQMPTQLPSFSASPAPAATLKPWQNSKILEPFTKTSKALVPPIPETSITIKAVGDIIPGTNYPYNKLPGQKQILFQSVKSQLKGADILFGNFESTLTNYPYSAKNISRGMTFAFRTPPSYTQILKDAGFHVLSVANNHSMDFFEAGFEDTMKNIQSAGMKAVGKKGQILYFSVKNVPVAFIAFSNYDYHNSMLDLTAAKALVKEAQKKARIVAISVHAGAEGTGAIHTRNQTETFFGENRGNMVLFSRTMIDAGADLILGHGPHVPRAIELYKGKLIAYSLGNFLGYRTLSTASHLGSSLILQVEVNSHGDFVAGKILPVQLDGQGIPYSDQSFRSVKLIQNLTKSDFPNTKLTIDNNGKISLKQK